METILKTVACSVFYCAASSVASALLFAGLSYAAPPETLPNVVPGNYIVVFHDGVDSDKTVSELAQRHINMSVHYRYQHALRGMAVRIPPALLEILKADPRVDYIEQDQRVSINAQKLPTGIDRIDAERNPVANIDGVDERVNADIAILDTGVDLDHPDLNVFKYVLCKQQGFQFKCTEGDTNADDVDGHGTHVAGIAAAIDNTSDVVGMAPGARIWNIKVLEDDGTGVVSNVIAGVDYVIANASAIEVANLSLTGDGSSNSLDTAISNAVAAGVVITLAAGNGSNDVSQVFPAGSPGAITVSAFEDFDGLPGGISGNPEDDTFANFSNYGAGVDIMAPGKTIRSTRVGGGTSNKSGTSMASPHVAGAAALYLSQNPGASPAAVLAVLLASGDPAPCATSDGICGAPQDPDGIQEPLLCNDLDGDAICDYLDSCPTVDNNSLLDGDGDGLTDFEECLLGTDATDTDSDNDTLSDYVEVNTYNTNPLLSDTDADGVNDGDEVTIWNTDPLGSNIADLAPVGTRNGIVNIADYVILLRMINGELTPTAADVAFADLNKNGSLDVGDAVLMSRIVLGPIPVP